MRIVVGTLEREATPEEEAEILASIAGIVSTAPEPGPPEPYLNNGGSIRFTCRPVAVQDPIRFSGAFRVARGVYRALLSEHYPNDQFMAIPAVMDPNPCSIRVTARTASYVEIRVVNPAGTTYDPLEITIETKRVIQQ